MLSNRSSYVVFGAVFGEGMFFFCVFPFVGAMLLERGAGGLIAAGVALAGFAVGGVIYGAVVRHMIRFLGQWNMLRVGGLMAGFSYFIVAVPMGPVGVALAFMIAGFGFYMMHNTLQTQATELAPRARGSTFALFSASMFLGQGIRTCFRRSDLQPIGISVSFRVGRGARRVSRPHRSVAFAAPRLGHI